MRMVFEYWWVLAGFAFWLTLFRFTFVHWWPRGSVFWKRTDYVYYSLAAVGIVLGIVDTSRQGLQRELIGVVAERDQKYRVLSTMVTHVVSYCDLLDRIDAERRAEREREAERARQSIERHRRHPSIIIPDDLEGYGSSGFFGFALTDGFDAEYSVSTEGCRLARNFSNALLLPPNHLDVNSARSLLTQADEVRFSYRSMESEWSYDLADVQAQVISLQEYRAVGWIPDGHDLLSDILDLNGRERALHELLLDLDWSRDRASGFGIPSLWPLLLVTALALRLTKVHAEIRAEKSKGGPTTSVSSYYRHVTQRRGGQKVRVTSLFILAGALLALRGITGRSKRKR